MTHEPCLSPSGEHRGQFVLGDTRFGSAAVTDRDDQSNPHRTEVRFGDRLPDRQPRRSWAQ